MMHVGEWHCLGDDPDCLCFKFIYYIDKYTKESKKRTAWKRRHQVIDEVIRR